MTRKQESLKEMKNKALKSEIRTRIQNIKITFYTYIGVAILFLGGGIFGIYKITQDKWMPSQLPLAIAFAVVGIFFAVIAVAYGRHFKQWIFNKR